MVGIAVVEKDVGTVWTAFFNIRRIIYKILHQRVLKEAVHFRRRIENKRHGQILQTNRRI